MTEQTAPPAKPQLNIKLRPADQEDVGFIFNSWLKSYRQSPATTGIPSQIYFGEQHKLVERLLKDSTVVVACSDEDETQLYGYICATRVEGILCVHYIYIKHTFRSLGIGKMLLNAFEHDPSAASVYTHSTRIAAKLATKYNLIYHPYLLMNFDNNK